MSWVSVTGPAALGTCWLDLTGRPGIDTVKRSPLYGTSPVPVVAAVLGVELGCPPAVELGRPLAVDVAPVPEPVIVVVQADGTNSARPAVSTTAARFAVTSRQPTSHPPPAPIGRTAS